jgi:mRNA interferase HicA
MNRDELIRRARRLAKVRGLGCRVDEKRGKGSHLTLYFGDRFAVVPRGELKSGTLAAILKQLGVEKDEI